MLESSKKDFKAIKELKTVLSKTFISAILRPLPKASFEHKKANLGFRGTHVYRIRLRFHDLDLPFSESKPLHLSIMQRS